MLRLTTFIAALLLCQALGTNGQHEYVQDVVKSNNAFSTSLYRALTSEEGNLVVTPFSVHTAMSLIWTGAGGDTAQELQSSLHLPASRSQVETGFRILLPNLNRSDDITLNVTNKLCLEQRIRINDTYRMNAVDNFRCDIEEVTFNRCEELMTHNETRNLIAPGPLSNTSLIVVVSAIYFHGWWMKPFPENNTRVETFYLTSTSSVNVSMMHNTDYFSYTEVEELNVKALKLRYRHLVNYTQVDSMSMLILLPNAIDGLPQLESRIASVNITNITQQMIYTLASVSLPRFKIEQTRSLKDTLKKLGIRKVFQSDADLSGITDRNVWISTVLQNAFVQVTENGTNAASATYFDLLVRTDRDPPPLNFTADHPFLFYILDDVSGAILFMERVAHPN